jgi:hypothetical protein
VLFLLTIAPDCHLLATQSGLSHRRYDLIRELVRNFDERKRIANLNCAKRAGRYPGLACNGADKVSRPDAGATPGPDKQANDIAIPASRVACTAGGVTVTMRWSGEIRLRGFTVYEGR